MVSTNNINIEDFTFSKPAVYQIKVKGTIDINRSRHLGDMQIRVIKMLGSNTISELVGTVSDQAALSGILNTLNDMHLVILSVKILKEMTE